MAHAPRKTKRGRVAVATVFAITGITLAATPSRAQVGGATAGGGSVAVAPPVPDLDLRLAETEAGMRTREAQARPVEGPAAMTLVGAGLIVLSTVLPFVSVGPDSNAPSPFLIGVSLAPIGPPLLVAGAIWWADRARTRAGLDAERNRLQTARIVPWVLPVSPQGQVGLGPSSAVPASSLVLPGGLVAGVGGSF